VFRGSALALAGVLALSTQAPAWAISSQPQAIKQLAAQLTAADPEARARAACELGSRGDDAAEAIAPLVALLADGSPVQSPVCERRWWRGGPDEVTTPGEQAAAALVSIGTRSFEPVLTALHAPTWVTRRNAAWALGAFDERRAVTALIEALKDREPGVREQVAWALGAIDDVSAVPALIAALKDDDSRVRRQAAWALGAIDDNRAAAPLAAALSDPDDKVREQAAWALGAIDDSSAVDALVRALNDKSARVRRQAAWALGAIGDSRALASLLPSLKDADAGVRKQAAWAIGVIGR
jgi:HEAT repeat protein